MYSEILRKSAQIKIIGDSIAAGAGASCSEKTSELILETANKAYYKRVSPNSWWGLLESYIKEKYGAVSVVNLACGGASSAEIRQDFDALISDEDDIVILLMGLNDRKRPDGMNELAENCGYMLDKLLKMKKSVVLATPNPSVYKNEHYENRLYHTDEVVGILRRTAEKYKVALVDNYKYINDYLAEKKLTIDDIIFGDGCINDGLHPSDFVQRLIFENFKDTMQI